MAEILSFAALDPARFERPDLLKKVTAASRRLAELKGVAASIPHQGILINTLGIQEAKDSSAIENIVTTHDELFRNDALPAELGGAAAKEVLRYRQALRVGFEAVQTTGLLTSRDVLSIQAVLERNDAGFRRLPGTTLQDGRGRVVYTPPDPTHIPALMGALERFINDEPGFDADPLIRMALIHH